SRKRQDDVAEDMITYREDLAKVVKPSHPVSTRHHDESRAKTPTPLVLVSEQRIDEIRKPEPQIAATSASVRPRRISTGNLAYEEDESLDEDENIFASGTQSFARYATEMGANELPDLLEAAAAYTAFVEGQPYFSRPQIMKAVEELSAPDEFTREDGLRSFGMLLRRGKIHKIKPGQFRIDDSSRFKPEGNAEQH
ncbi:MAG: chemotaxis protein CheA, partial [Paracoccaceae bacterium]|nr:chemotaxis protein CheA [Paracoccaceae bacterium]